MDSVNYISEIQMNKTPKNSSFDGIPNMPGNNAIVRCLDKRPTYYGMNRLYLLNMISCKHSALTHNTFKLISKKPKSQAKGLISVILFTVAIFLMCVFASENCEAETSYGDVAIGQTVYQIPDNTGYVPKDEYITSQPVFGADSITTVTVCDSKGEPFINNRNGDRHILGFNNPAIIKVDVKFDLSSHICDSPWRLDYDSWGNYTDQTILGGDYVGNISFGKIFFQYFHDGRWDYYAGPVGVDLTRGSAELKVMGNDLNKGTQFRVVTAYEMCHHYTTREGWWFFAHDVEHTDYLNFLEISDPFTVVSSDIDSPVTFRNLTIEEQRQDLLDQDIIEAVGITMTGDSLTTSGFTIDSSNPYLNFIVKKDGREVNIPSDMTFCEDGQYEITVESQVGTSKTTTLFVDKDGHRSSYFGNLFKDAERVYDDSSDRAVFVTGFDFSFCYNPTALKEVESSKLINETYGIETPICDAGRIEGEGNFRFEFRVGNPESGDIRTYRFSFTAISESNVPGPQINIKGLNDSCCRFPDSAYAVSLGTAGPGNVTLLFANWDSAFYFAVSEEKRKVETDGTTYWYSGNSSFKKQYDAVGLEIAVRETAETMVYTHVIDLDDPTTFRTMKATDISSSENLVTEYLKYTVVLYATEEDRRILTEDSVLIIGMTVAYLEPDINGDFTINTITQTDYTPVSDDGGIDSCNLIASIGRDSQELCFGKSLMAQFKELNMPESVIHLKEANLYGRTNEYDVIYHTSDECITDVSVIAEGAVFEIKDGCSLITKSFCFNEASSKFGFDLIKVKSDVNSDPRYFTSNSMCEFIPDVGTYQITIIDVSGGTLAMTLQVCQRDDNAQDGPVYIAPVEKDLPESNVETTEKKPHDTSISGIILSVISFSLIVWFIKRHTL